jgi:hypothetical protein
MKTRTGFVSNSSSSSFLIPREFVSEAQLKKIRRHIHLAQKTPEIKERHGWGIRDGDEWTILEGDDNIVGYTIMDNFDMKWFLTSFLGLPEVEIEWDDGLQYIWGDITEEDLKESERTLREMLDVVNNDKKKKRKKVGRKRK